MYIPPTWQACKIWFATNGVTMLQNHLCGRDTLDTDGRWVSLTADADIWDDDRDVNIDFNAKGKGRVRMKVMMVLMIMMVMMITSMSMMRNSTRTLTLMPLISVGTSKYCDSRWWQETKPILCFSVHFNSLKSFQLWDGGFRSSTWSRNGMKRPNRVSGLQFCLEALRCNLVGDEVKTDGENGRGDEASWRFSCCLMLIWDSQKRLLWLGNFLE